MITTPIVNHRGFLAIALFFAGVLSAPAGAAEPCAVKIDPAKELIITNPLVVEDKRADPGGPWHMATLLNEMLPQGAPQSALSDFILKWLKDALAVSQINQFKLPFPGPALGERIVCRWVEENGGKNCTAASVNPARIPYKLIAISNRLDLHGHTVDQAEGRFIFAALSGPTDHPTSDTSVNELPETVIFEYHLPLKSEADLNQWAADWHELGSLACTTKADCEPFRARLERITKAFSTRGLVVSKPNGNSIGQIRTSHVAPGGVVWSFRQFELKGEGNAVSLVSTPTAQTPDVSLDNAEALSQIINQNRESILADTFILPAQFLGGQSLMDDLKSHQWEFDVDENLRKAFSQHTCNGCHGETANVDTFFQISPVTTGHNGQDRLSPFLVDEELPKRAEVMKQRLCSMKNKT